MQLAIQLGEEELKAIALDVAKYLKPLLSISKSSEPDQFYDVAGLAKYLNVSRDWIYKKVSQHNIPYMKTGRLIKFRKSSIDRWMEETAVKPLPVNPAKRYLGNKGTEDC
ncbi:MAG: helix-turn-helix domain-containing protein [Pedobacter sp.]